MRAVLADRSWRHHFLLSHLSVSSAGGPICLFPLLSPLFPPCLPPLSPKQSFILTRIQLLTPQAAILQHCLATSDGKKLLQSIELLDRTRDATPASTSLAPATNKTAAASGAVIDYTVQSDGGFTPEALAAIGRVFARFDGDSDGLLSCDDFNALQTALGQAPVEEADFRELMVEALGVAPDSDGRVGLDALVKMYAGSDDLEGDLVNLGEIAEVVKNKPTRIGWDPDRAKKAAEARKEGESPPTMTGWGPCRHGA